MSGCMEGGVAAIGASGVDAVEKLESSNGTVPKQTPHPSTNPQVESSAVARHRSNSLHIKDPRYSSAVTLLSSRSFHTQRSTAPPSNSQTTPPVALCKRYGALYNQDLHSSSDLALPPRSSSRSRTSTSQAGETRPCNPDTKQASAVSTNTAENILLPQSPPPIVWGQSCVSNTDDICDITREAKEPLCKRILRTCDNAYYKLALRVGRRR